MIEFVEFVKKRGNDCGAEKKTRAAPLLGMEIDAQNVNIKLLSTMDNIHCQSKQKPLS